MSTMGSINSRGRQIIPTNGARLTMIFEQQVPLPDLEVSSCCDPLMHKVAKMVT